MKSQHPMYLRRLAARIAGAWVSSVSLLLASSAWATPAAVPSKDLPSTKADKGGATEQKAQVESAGVGFAVQEIFTGTFVFGITGIWGPATDRDYRGVKVPGSEQAEISLVSDSEMESDLVLGYVHYLEDQGPTGCQGIQCLSPVFGLGVYSWRTEEIFKSLMIGANYQFNRHVSLAAVLALRRVNVLRNGKRLGMPGEDGGDYSDENYRLGWGFMLNFSPDILKSGFKATRTLDFSSVSEKLTE